MEEAVDNNLFVPKGYSDQVDIKEEMAVDNDVSLLELDTNPFLSKNKQRFDIMYCSLCALFLLVIL